MVEDRASCGNYSPRFGSWFANTDLEEDGELAPRRHRDVAVAAPRASRGTRPYVLDDIYVLSRMI